MAKNNGCVITFIKDNGDIIMRPRLRTFGLKIGDETSMGWKVLDIHYQYLDGNYYHEEDFSRLLRKQKKTIKQKIAEYIMHKVNAWR